MTLASIFGWHWYPMNIFIGIVLLLTAVLYGFLVEIPIMRNLSEAWREYPELHRNPWYLASILVVVLMPLVIAVLGVVVIFELN